MLITQFEVGDNIAYLRAEHIDIDGFTVLCECRSRRDGQEKENCGMGKCAHGRESITQG